MSLTENSSSPFEGEIELYNRKVKEILLGLQRQYPKNDPQTLRPLAEELASSYAPVEQGKQKRSN